MRGAWLLALLLAGCVDPAARVEPEVPAAPTDAVGEQVVIHPVIDLRDAMGRAVRQIMLGENVTLVAHATPMEGLARLSYHWVEQGDMASGGELLVDGAIRSQPVEPGSEGSLPIMVRAVSVTGHAQGSAIVLGVGAREHHEYDLPKASPLDDVVPCQPVYDLLGRPAWAEERFTIQPVLGEAARFAFRAASGVHASWCTDGALREQSVQPDGSVVTLVWPGEAGDEIVLWTANVDASVVAVSVERIYPGDPLH